MKVRRGRWIGRRGVGRKTSLGLSKSESCQSSEVSGWPGRPDVFQVAERSFKLSNATWGASTTHRHTLNSVTPVHSKFTPMVAPEMQRGDGVKLIIDRLARMLYGQESNGESVKWYRTTPQLINRAQFG